MLWVGPGPAAGQTTCVVTGPVIRRAPDLVECSVLAVLKCLWIFEQGALYLHFALGLTNYASGPLNPGGAVLTCNPFQSPPPTPTPPLIPLVGLKVNVNINGQFTLLNGSLHSNNQCQTSELHFESCSAVRHPLGIE